MKIHFDESRCASTGMCESLAPEVFEISLDGTLTILDVAPEEFARSEVQAACDACPTAALRLSDPVL